MNSMKRQKDRTLKDELPRSVGAQYATGHQWINNSTKNEETEPKQKQHPVDVTGDGSKAQYRTEQYCIGTGSIRSMNQGNLEVVKQEMARVNINILGISELKWTGMGEYLLLWARIPEKKWISHHSQQRSPKCRTWMQSQKQQNDLCLFPRQTVQYYGNPSLCLTSNAEEDEVEWFYEDLQDLLELTPKKDILFNIGYWNAKVESQEIPGVTGKFDPGVQNEAGKG